MCEFITLGKGPLRLTLCKPGGYYRGTRFDWSGVFRSIELGSESFADLWSDSQDPYLHDHLCGNSEEFLQPLGYDSAPLGGSFLKVGVGMLEKYTDGPYERFHTYKILDPGTRTLEIEGSRVRFSHMVKGVYDYVKEVEIVSEYSYVIRHRITVDPAYPQLFSVQHYNHNFFTLNLGQVGPERSVHWNNPFDGDFRADSVNASKDEYSIRIDAPMQKGQAAFIGNIKASTAAPLTGFVLSSKEKHVELHCDQPFCHAVFWSNNRVFCPEPYIDISIEPGKTFEWTLEYKLVSGIR